jgi:2-haloacid dehalogenase
MLDFSRFEVLTFDCYGTLINWEEGILRCLRGLLSEHRKDSDDATILELYGDFEAEAEQHEFRRYREILGSVVQQEKSLTLFLRFRKLNPWPSL